MWLLVWLIPVITLVLSALPTVHCAHPLLPNPMMEAYCQLGLQAS